jgi:hypothetical protein
VIEILLDQVFHGILLPSRRPIRASAACCVRRARVVSKIIVIKIFSSREKSRRKRAAGQSHLKKSIAGEGLEGFYRIGGCNSFGTATISFDLSATGRFKPPSLPSSIPARA